MVQWLCHIRAPFGVNKRKEQLCQKNNTARPKDRKGRVLRTGKSQRKDGTYDYRYTDKDHNRHSIYATTLEELPKKEAEVLICTMLGIGVISPSANWWSAT